MRGAWLTGLVIFTLVAGGFILVRGRAEGEQAALGTLLADQARESVQAVTGGLGRPADEAEPEREPGTYYRYTDAAGTIRFVNSLADVPVAFQASVREVSNDRVQHTSSSPATGVRDDPAARGARPKHAPREVAPLEQHAMQHEVVVYTTSWCGWCRKTLTYLRQQGVPFENRDIEADHMWRDELREKTGSTSIPVVEIDGEIIRGYNPGRMAQLLRSS